MKKLIFLTILALSANIANAQWQQANGPYGGIIHCIETSGTNIFAGTFGGGMFLSINKGSDWIEINNGLTDILISVCL